MHDDYPSVAKPCTFARFGTVDGRLAVADQTQAKSDETPLFRGLRPSMDGSSSRLPGFVPRFAGSGAPCSKIWPLRCLIHTFGSQNEGVCVAVNGRTPSAERRRWPRLPLAIPVFVRSQSDSEKEFLEFATALNVSAGGMLVALRRSIPSAAQVLLEIPSAPLAALADLPNVARSLRAKVLRMEHGEGYNLVGVKFSRPLGNSHAPVRQRRKLASPV